MRSLAIAFLALAVAAAAAAGPPDAAPSNPPSVIALFRNPEISMPVLSDDGETFAVIHSRGDRQLVLTRAVRGGTLKPVARLDDPEMRLSWLAWANDRRLLLSGETRRLNSIGVRARATQLFGVDRDGANFRWLGKRWPRFGNEQVSVQFEDEIAHWTPDDPEHVLVKFESPYRDEWPRIMRLDVNSGALRLAHPGKPTVRSWYADRRGDVRAGVGVTADDQYELWARIDPQAELAVVSRHPAVGLGETFLGFHEDPTKLYVMKPHEGRDAIFEFDLKGRTLGALVFSHPEVDVDGLVSAPSGDGHVIGFAYTTDSPQIHFIDEAAGREHRGIATALSRAFGQAVQVFPVSRSRDGEREILAVSSDTQPPAYYVYDRGVKRLHPLLEERPDISPEQLSPTTRVTYRARDGLEIPAYLTLPRESEGKALPLIALIHGGPWARDWIRWDAEVQLFASRGFAVLQPNFRGSSGLGVAHLTAGYREWGQKIQDDITDGVKWAITEGIADPDRVGIYGISFGGYSSLAGAVKTADLYRAVAAYAPVTDIETLIADDAWYEWGTDWHETMVGGERGDRERLRSASPLRNASAIRVPVLLGHGVDDPRIHVKQSQRMAKALRDAGKPVEYLEFPDEVHGFLLEANRIRWYEALIAFFEKNLAPREKPVEAETAAAAP